MKKIFISSLFMFLSVIALNAQETDIDDYDFHSESREKSSGNLFPRIKGAKVSYGLNYSQHDYSTFENQYTTDFSVNAFHPASGFNVELWTRPIGFSYRRFQMSEMTYVGAGENFTLSGSITSFGLTKALYYQKKKFFSAIEVSYQMRKLDYFISNSTISNSQTIFTGTYNSSRIVETRTELKLSLLNHLTLPKFGKKLQGISLNINPSINIPFGESSFESLGVNLNDVRSNQDPYFSLDVSLGVSFLRKKRKSSSMFKF